MTQDAATRKSYVVSILGVCGSTHWCQLFAASPEEAADLYINGGATNSGALIAQRRGGVVVVGEQPHPYSAGLSPLISAHRIRVYRVASGPLPGSVLPESVKRAHVVEQVTA